MKMRIWTATLYFVSVWTVGYSQVLNPDNGHTYDTIPIPANFTWHQSRDSCESLGGHLATVADSLEQNFLYALVVAVSAPDCWLGGTDETMEGEWGWVIDEPFTFTNWRPGEPNNHFGGENYIHFSVELDGQWNDARNWFVQPGYFIVEWDFCCHFRGDIDHSGGQSPVDISDLVFVVDYMFNGGPEPPCFEEADLDASGGIDIADLVYLVDYMFRGGPPPVCP